MMNYLLNLDQPKNPISGSIWAKDQVQDEEFILGHRLALQSEEEDIFGRRSP